MSSDPTATIWQVGGMPVHDFGDWADAVLDAALGDICLTIERNGVRVATIVKYTD